MGERSESTGFNDFIGKWGIYGYFGIFQQQATETDSSNVKEGMRGWGEEGCDEKNNQ